MCIVATAPASTVSPAFLSSLHLSSTFPLPSLPHPLPSLHSPSTFPYFTHSPSLSLRSLPACSLSVSSLFLFLTPKYGYLLPSYLIRMRESWHHWLPFALICLFTWHTEYWYDCFVMCVLFCSVLLSSHGPDGPELFMIDPSGVSWVRKIHFLDNCEDCSANSYKTLIVYWTIQCDLL